jgi:antitoxin component of MazEF toxin-antitoxin module
MRQKIRRLGSSAGIIIPKSELAELQLAIGDEVKVTIEAVKKPKRAAAYSAITAHGRFQPPLHINHWNYLQEAFKLAEHVRLLITNPFPEQAPESHDAAASWRTQKESNPFSYDERVFMYHKFFETMGISKTRYSIEPFDITNPESFKVLDPAVPNLVNVYSEWSAGKVQKFRDNGLTVMQLDQPKSVDVSGTQIREIINQHQGGLVELGPKLIAAGFMTEAVPGLIEVLEARNK